MSTSPLAETFSSSISAQYHAQQQITRLIQRGYPKFLGVTPDSFTAQMQRLVFGALAGYDVPSHSYPFLIVIPQKVVPFEKQVELMRFEGYPGRLYLELDGLYNWWGNSTEKPLAPYVAFDIDCGHDFLGQTPENARLSSRRRGRFPLTLAEVIAQLTQWPDTLRMHNFHASGSVLPRPEGEFVVDVYRYGSVAKFKKDLPTDSAPEWTTPTCKLRLTA